MRVFAIDPGNIGSAYCVIDAETLKPLEFAKVSNNELRQIIRDWKFEETDYAVLEALQSYGNLIGKDVLDTAYWLGRFAECLTRKTICEPLLVYRIKVKVHICHDSRAKDSNIRRALIDRFATHDFANGKGTKKNRDWFYGFHSDIWSAYSVALYATETLLKREKI